jgi:glycosyltransferase involved in cell wall biosynthesis
MKVVRIIARLNVGGPAKHVVWLTTGLNPEYQTVLVAGTVPEGEEDMSYFASAHGVTPLFLRQMSREVSFRDAVTVWRLFRLFLREKPELVHTHTAKAGTVGRVAGFFYRWLTPGALIGKPRSCRFIHTYHGHIFHGYYGRLKTSLFLTVEKTLARLVTDKIVVVSEQQRREINQTFGVGHPEQFRVIPLGLDLSPFTGSQNRRETFRSELGVGRDDLLVGIVGRLTEIKNHDLFLRVVARLAETVGPKVKFVIIGEGNLRAQLENQARTLGLEASVKFAGNRADPENFYPALDIVALTSRNEGTPLTLIEAMANGRAVIATAVGGVVDLLGDCTAKTSGLPYVICRRGISVPANNVEAFAAGLNRLAADEALREELGANGLQYVKQVHSKERLLADIRKLYGEG